MTLNDKRLRVHTKLAAMPGVRPVRRPVTADGPEHFDLFYVRTGRKSARPLVIIPGGPGVASVQMYKGLRRRAAAEGLDVIMIEHRGVGMSRHDDTGADLPPQALTIDQVVDDVAAVLDDAEVDKAVLYGTSYGTYIAAGVGVRHRNRVTAMILDSPVLSQHDIVAVRAAIRGLLLDGDGPETAALAPKVRRLLDDGVLAATGGLTAAVLYSCGGTPLLDRQLNLLLGGRTWLWSGLGHLGKTMLTRKAPYRNEVDLVGRIGFRELDYAGEPDGLPLDPSEVMRELSTELTDFEAEPYDLFAEMPTFDWPVVVISGGRDLTTPPAVADQVAALIPGAILVRLPTTCHSALDTHERVALAVSVAVCAGDVDMLAERGDDLDRLPTNVEMRLLIAAISAAARIEGALPAVVPRLVHWATS